jgi:LysM repeat protein
MNQEESTRFHERHVRSFGFGPRSLRAGLNLTTALVMGIFLSVTAAVNMVVAPGNGATEAAVGQLFPPIPLPASADDPPSPAVSRALPNLARTPARAAAPASTAPVVQTPAAPAPVVQTPAAPAPTVGTEADAAAQALTANAYTVVAGDSVWSIAQRFGVDWQEMLAANGLGPYSVILPGQVLKLRGLAVSTP